MATAYESAPRPVLRWHTCSFREFFERSPPHVASQGRPVRGTTVPFLLREKSAPMPNPHHVCVSLYARVTHTHSRPTAHAVAPTDADTNAKRCALRRRCPHTSGTSETTSPLRAATLPQTQGSVFKTNKEIVQFMATVALIPCYPIT